MKFKLERHLYAPELNKIRFASGASLAANGATTIKQAREMLFKQATYIRTVTILFKRPDRTEIKRSLILAPETIKSAISHVNEYEEAKGYSVTLKTRGYYSC